MGTLRKTSALSAFCILVVLILPLVFVGGCTSKLDGEMTANQKPLVWFVNVPPEDYSSSVNPIINWYGQDRDGQIEFFRYIVIREDQIGDSLGKPPGWNPVADPLTNSEVREFVDDVLIPSGDYAWTELVVDAEEGAPQTSNIIPMTAEIDNPVLTLVPQLVFVQAFDEQGLGSDIAFRRFYRNDNPPDTRILGFIEGVPFINSPVWGGPATGIRMRWEGSDIVDYPTDPPPFEFEWNLYGPFSDSLFAEFVDSFFITVFVTNDAQVFRFGQPPDTVIDSIVCNGGICDTFTHLFPTAYIVCDTTFEDSIVCSAPDDCDTFSLLVESCDTIYIDTITLSNVYGTLDTLFRTQDDDFINSSIYNRVADSSNDWITSTRDSMFNVYWNYPTDTTVEMNFAFAVRSRDDAGVPDLTPTFKTFTVIHPMHERDILVVDWSIWGVNNGFHDSAGTYWTDAIGDWIATRPNDGLEFDPDLDFISLEDGYVNSPDFLRLLLARKQLVLIQDAGTRGYFMDQTGAAVPQVYTALQTGVNVWLSMRVPIGDPTEGRGPQVFFPPGPYQWFFGTTQIAYSGWSYYARRANPKVRVEDFVGALSLDTARWPDLTIDTALLHRRYNWPLPVYGWDSTGSSFTPVNYEDMPIGALPEVNWAVRSFETEAMYLYNSCYGAEHFLGADLSFHGRPVAHRLNRGIFRTVHFLFTPMSFEGSTMQITVNDVLNWLYDGYLIAHQTAGREGSKSARDNAIASELRQRYWENYWNANGDKDDFYFRMIHNW